MNKKYLLYVGLFVAGAVITPLYLSLFGSSDRPSTVETEQTGFTDKTTDNINMFNTEDTVTSSSTPQFAPDDSREMIEQDYTIQQRSLRTATTLPQFAREQSPPAPYPNYAAIPAPKISVPDTVIPKPAIAPSTSPRSTSDTLTGLNPDRALAINTTAPSQNSTPQNSVLQNSIQSIPANTLLSPTSKPEDNRTQNNTPNSPQSRTPSQIPILDNNPNNIQTDWLRNNLNRPAATGEKQLNPKP